MEPADGEITAQDYRKNGALLAPITSMGIAMLIGNEKRVVAGAK